MQIEKKESRKLPDDRTAVVDTRSDLLLYGISLERSDDPLAAAGEEKGIADFCEGFSMVDVERSLDCDGG